MNWWLAVALYIGGMVLMMKLLGGFWALVLALPLFYILSKFTDPDSGPSGGGGFEPP